MNKKHIFQVIDYFSLILVLSYIFFHNIYTVFIGIAMALFSINKKQLSSLNKTFFHRTTLTKQDDKLKDRKKIEIQSADKNQVSLVEIIEESGFIPSSDNKNDNIAA
tara:strand:- start:855 stop:1175 length:321 start_codon:yes stop_codon:yes gene_type:complete